MRKKTGEKAGGETRCKKEIKLCNAQFYFKTDATASVLFFGHSERAARKIVIPASAGNQ
jgi:hypothetical protein